MAGVTRALTLTFVLVLVAGAAGIAAVGCASKVPPADAGRAAEPHRAAILPEDIPRHIDGILEPLQTDLLAPVRVTLRGAKVSTSGVASDGSYSRWLMAVSETLVEGGALPKNIGRLSHAAYDDLAHILGRPTGRNTSSLDLALLAQRLQVYFHTQSLDARKIAAAYIESVFSIVG